MGFLATLLSIISFSPLPIFLLLFFLLFASVIVYPLLLAIYRLTLHPLASYPGPKLTAATGWVEAYYELFADDGSGQGGGGQFTFQVWRWHKKYGPIIRINPWELHIEDPSFYETVYTSQRAHDKPHTQNIIWRFNTPTGAFSTPSSALHRLRRNALAPYFSKRKVASQEPFIATVLAGLAERLRTEYLNTGAVLNLNDMFGAYSGDVVCRYTFGKETDANFCKAPGFKSPLTVGISKTLEMVHVGAMFPELVRLANVLPESWVVAMAPPMKTVLEFRRRIMEQVVRTLDEATGEEKKRHETGAAPEIESEDFVHDSIFTQISSSRTLPDHERSAERLNDEAVSIVGAGLESTKQALCTAFYHLLANPSILARLRAELDPLPPHPSLSELEQLPFLRACIDETIRVSYGAVGRSARVAPSKTPWVYLGRVIPHGTPVSLDTWHMHNDATIFPSPRVFNPDRVYEKKYLTSFGKGSRICIGMNLALAEIAMALAELVRRFDLELYETGPEDVECARDYVAPQARKGTKGVRVLVTGMRG